MVDSEVEVEESGEASVSEADGGKAITSTKGDETSEAEPESIEEESTRTIFISFLQRF